jgi:tetratricopeptide (TPR) repeat protein
MRFLLASMAGGLAAAISAPAIAAWNVAESKHFVIYADEKPEQLAAFASRLERFDKAARYLRGMDDPPVGIGNRLTVFVLPSVGAVSKLAGDKYIEGFYNGVASGSTAFVPRTADENNPLGISADTIFFHEYSHHLMFQAIDRPLPEWVVEGFAEFMSTVRFDKNGDIGIGLPASHRAWGLYEGMALPLETMISGSYSKLSPEQRESIYGRGWLLVHYLTFEKSRAGQLDRYADLLAKGTPSLDAARTAFGDLKKLDRELGAYLERGRLTYLKLAGPHFAATPIAIHPLSPGAAKVIMFRARSRRGVNEKTAEPLAAQVRAVEAAYPGDELVELTLAEAEIDAGHIDAAEAAADRTLKANPRNTKALVFKGRAIAERSMKLDGPARRAGLEEARKFFLAANRLDTEDPEPLAMFYSIFVMEGVKPTANAIAALHYASDLAPQDEGLRMTSATAYLNDGSFTEAKRALTPVAYDPHGGKLAEIARRMIEKIDSGEGKSALAAAAAEAASGSSAH